MLTLAVSLKKIANKSLRGVCSYSGKRVSCQQSLFHCELVLSDDANKSTLLLR